MKVVIRVEKGEVEILYPDVGEKCVELGKLVRDKLKKLLELEDEQLLTCFAGGLMRDVLNEERKKDAVGG